MDPHLARLDPSPPPDADVPRFEVPTRIVHWALAGPFVVLLLSGLTNYFPTLKATQLGGERLFALLHVITGFGALAAIALLVLPQLARPSARRDLAELARVRLDDYLWLQHQVLAAIGGRSVAPPVRKFNAGQKLNALLSLGATAALMATGVILGLNFLSKRFFTADFVESVFPLHTWFALLFIPVLLAHLFLALVNPSTREALRAIIVGRVRRDWAAHHHAAWLADLESDHARRRPAPPSRFPPTDYAAIIELEARRRPASIGSSVATSIPDRELAIRVRGLHRSYGAFEAVRGLDLDIYRGECFALLGPNGAGKTTTIEILEGYRPRSAGEVTVLGFDPALSEQALRERVGIVLQETVADPYLTVREMVEMFTGYFPHPLPAAEAITLVGLTAQADTRVRRLSGGQRRRLDVALGIVGDPELLFLDEPTTGFDPNARRDAWEMVRGLRSLGKTVVLTTHYLDEAQQLADRVGIMTRGRLIALGTPDELMGSGGEALIEFEFAGSEGTPPNLPASAIVENGRVVIPTTEPTRVLQPLIAWATSAGRELPGLRVTRPSLEDVYLELVRHAEEALG